MGLKKCFGTLVLCFVAASLYAQNSVIETLKVNGESEFNGYSTFNQYTMMNHGASINGPLSIYTGKDLNHFEFLVNNEDSMPTLGMFTKPGFTAPMRFVASRYAFTGEGDMYIDGNTWFSKGINVNNEASFQNGITVLYGGTPLNVRIHVENNKPVIGFYGKDRYTTSGTFKGRSFTFEGGSVGIGINADSISKDVKLQVNGKLLCTGDIEVASIDAEDINTKGIKTDDITVKMNNVADYVFEENYNLKQLSDVEEYVKENKHLPGIPSASEIEENGVSLSKMTNLLLEKVEELTLHMIKLEKENNDLRAQVKTLLDK